MSLGPTASRFRSQKQSPFGPRQGGYAVHHLWKRHPLPLLGRSNERVLEGTETVQRMDVHRVGPHCTRYRARYHRQERQGYGILEPRTDG